MIKKTKKTKDFGEFRREKFIARDGIEEIREGWFYVPTYNQMNKKMEPIEVGDSLDLIGYFLWDDTKRIMYQPNYGARDLPKQLIYFRAADDWLEELEEIE